MWYKKAQHSFGGGILSPVELKIQQALSASPSVPITENPIENPIEETTEAHNPINESTDEYEKRIWDTLVNRSDTNQSDGPITDMQGNLLGNGPAIEANDARRLSPHHLNPEETTMEEQLEAVRHENVNQDPSQSMSSTEGSRGDMRVRGEYPYASGKGWNGYVDLPSDKSWA